MKNSYYLNFNKKQNAQCKKKRKKAFCKKKAMEAKMLKTKKATN